MHFWKFWNYLSKTRPISKFSKITMVIYPKNCSNQSCDYWFITPNQHFALKLISFNSSQLQISEREIRKQLWLQNNTVKGAMSITTNCVINQVICFVTNCFTLLTKVWMLQVRKSCSCGISAIFFQCCFMIEIQILMTVSNFSWFFLGIISWKGASLFNGGRGFKPCKNGDSEYLDSGNKDDSSNYDMIMRIYRFKIKKITRSFIIYWSTLIWSNIINYLNR